jgi:hypothetical protein
VIVIPSPANASCSGVNRFGRGILGGLQHQSRRRHTVHGWCASPNLRTPHTVSLDCLPFLPLRCFALPRLKLKVLNDEQSGVVAGDCLPTYVISYNLEAAAVELDQPAGCRRRQIQLEHKQRDKLGGRNHHSWCVRLSNRGSGAEHFTFSKFKSRIDVVGEECRRDTRMQKGVNSY